MSTELFCETYVAGGQPLQCTFGLLKPLPLCPRGAWGGTLAKALDTRLDCVALACVLLGSTVSNLNLNRIIYALVNGHKLGSYLFALFCDLFFVAIVISNVFLNQ